MSDDYSDAASQCFGTYDDRKFQDVSLDQDWRLWMFQVCTEWGYFTVRRLPSVYTIF